MKNILQEYDRSGVTLNNLSDTLKTLIKSMLDRRGIKVHQVDTRVKQRESLSKKILRKKGKYKNLSDITDIVGVRVITYFEDEIDEVAKIVISEFDVDKANSVDRRVIEADKFGYRSLHYVAGFNLDRLALSEYSNFKDIKFEFQIRSILQHSWAEIEHDLGYKGEFEIPTSAKRTFFRVAALLEQADLEFVKLKNTIREYESNIDKVVKNKPGEAGIDRASLISFITTNQNVIRIEEKIASCMNDIFVTDDDPHSLVSDSLISQMKALDINNIKKLEEVYLEHEKEFIENEQKSFLEEQVAGYERGASILWLIQYLQKEE